MKRTPRTAFTFLVAGGLFLLAGRVARADIPAGYLGKPFDITKAGGPKLPPTVKSGPYSIPGRLDFINYDMGGDGVGYHAGDHVAKGGAGYRIDGQTATLSWTGQCIANVGGQVCMNVWYDTSATLDNTPFPSATTNDFSIGAVQNGDWFNITVNVQTTGTYTLSSTWASGAGPPGGEGGDGTMGLAVFSNGTQIATWNAIFPNFNMYADFHHWKAYPNFATVQLTAGPQVIKLQSKAKHLQLDYVQFDLVGADGGVANPPDGGAGGASGAGGSTGAGGSIGSTGAGGTTGAGGSDGSTGAGGTTGAGGNSGSTGSAGDGGGSAGTGASTTGGAGTSGGSAGANGGSTTGAGGTKGAKSSGGCAVAGSPADAPLGALTGALLALGLVVRSRRRR